MFRNFFLESYLCTGPAPRPTANLIVVNKDGNLSGARARPDYLNKKSGLMKSPIIFISGRAQSGLIWVKVGLGWINTVPQLYFI